MSMWRAGRKLHVLAWWVAMIAAGNVRAEQGCGDGYIPTTTPNGVQCMPIPGLYQTPAEAPAPTVPRSRWADRWGAIATDSASGSTGIVGSMSSERKARQGALAQCKSKGGADCQIQITYSNQCGVLAWGNNKMSAARGATLEEASKMAIDECERGAGTSCKVFFSDCSLPERR
ncbi:DUF4189 domain-containing protein [Lysobacter sp. K5869]|nr:DUF4189 domain-containing protein [Lysobacter sp. K5869]